MESRNNLLFQILVLSTLFIASFLLFVIQPMVAKVIVPQLGGAAATWSYCLLFFQTGLLLGYSYSYILRRFMNPLYQVITHLSLCVLAMYIMPSPLLLLKHDLTAAGSSYISSQLSPIWSILGPLLVPVIIISSMTSLLQSWCQDTSSQKKAPFYMYAISNMACLMALITYLAFGGLQLVGTQWQYWLLGFRALLMLTIMVCLMQLAQAKTNEKASEELSTADEDAIDQLPTKKLIVEAAIPSALLCALSTYLATWTASVPMIWLVPLAVYLISYMITFSGSHYGKYQIEKVWPAAATVAILVYILGHKVPTSIALSTHIICFTLICFGLHQQVYDARPKTEGKRTLSIYYLFIAIGATLGTIFSSLLAPQLFDSFFEVPASYAIARLVFSPATMSNRKTPAPIKADFKWIPVYVVFCWVWLSWFSENLESAISSFSFILWVPLIFALAYRRPKPILFAFTCFALMVTHKIWQEKTLYNDRSFYAPLTVRQVTPKDRELINGETIHGRQNAINPKEPLSYYHKESGLGIFLEKWGENIEKVAAIGMGVGTISAYMESKHKITYFEIDPEIIKLVEDKKFFSYIADAKQRGVKTRIIEGDARISMDKENIPFDVIIVDAFLSSSIPVHLLTSEAIKLYMNKLSESGVVLLHISNRYLDFESVFAVHSKVQGYPGFIKRTGKAGPGKDPASWVALLKNNKDNQQLRWFKENWAPITQNRPLNLWTDQRANVFDILF